ncbi:MAG: hypothetical protein EBY22_05905 [Gammaproteobacteria bacterium]|nr:hypothetical protein [Gammaproteobacteria bacterium]
MGIQKLTDFSPRCFEATPIEWSIADYETICELKSSFSFLDNFDLHNYLAIMPIEIAAFIELDHQKPTEKETVIYLDEFNKTVSKSICVLQKMRPLISKEAKGTFSYLHHLLSIMGSRHLRLIAGNIRGAFATVNEVQNALEILCNEDYLNNLKINLLGLKKCVESSQATVSAPTSGRKSINLESGIIHKLLYIYTEGTGLKASCYWDRVEDQYTGRFYEFLLKTIGLLEKYTEIKSLEKKTWGRYAQKVISYHYIKQINESSI